VFCHVVRLIEQFRECLPDLGDEEEERHPGNLTCSSLCFSAQEPLRS
jgi:hypothetical protein